MNDNNLLINIMHLFNLKVIYLAYIRNNWEHFPPSVNKLKNPNTENYFVTSQQLDHCNKQIQRVGGQKKFNQTVGVKNLLTECIIFSISK